MTLKIGHDLDNPRKESITVDPEEDPITEDSRKTLSVRTLKKILSIVAFHTWKLGTSRIDCGKTI